MYAIQHRKTLEERGGCWQCQKTQMELYVMSVIHIVLIDCAWVVDFRIVSFHSAVQRWTADIRMQA